MSFIISRSAKGTKKYPMHRHNDYEISFCLNCEGTIEANGKVYPFCSGSIIVMPPDTMHLTKSEDELDSIYVRGNFNLLFNTKKPMVLSDNIHGDGKALALLIYNNRFSNPEFLSALCDAYIHFILTNMKTEDSIGRAVNQIIYQITENSFDPYINPEGFLQESGYAVDYIRSHFKRITGMTPHAFLTDIRIRHACFLIETYGFSLSLAQIAESCGYTDYVYFSKRFKAVTGVSPRKHKESVC